MKRSAFASFLTVTATLISVLPAYAGPLDTYSGSILDPSSSTLSTDPRALCSDIVANNVSKTSTSSDIESRYKSTYDLLNKSAQAESHSKDNKQSMGGSFMGIGANYSSENKSADSANSSNESRLGTSVDQGNLAKNSTDTMTSTAVAAGRNCDAFVNASAARDAAAFAADAQVKMTQIATDGKVKATKIEADQRFMESLLKW